MPQRRIGPDRWRFMYEAEPSGCWRWTGSFYRNGYGQFSVESNGRKLQTTAHRYVYQQMVRQVARDEELDHLCRNRACVNPEHLEPVSHAENVRRGRAGEHNAAKTHCINGHEFTAENTVRTVRGYRACRACRTAWSRDHWRRQRGADLQIQNGLKTHCPRGHEYRPENTIKPKRGGRVCRECSRQAVRECMRRKRALARETESVPTGSQGV